ncbi:lipopolysaccharide biosynthesis protein [Hymenobacter terrenus]|uniref:lipopolysaccharide biosynthesis protein n=1 Tax=Hymenobacter terrenus TaxID=1629124 RepID=UPI0006965450|nr:oligosaccharide flippase family protein [Hymenobacter terrenus]
MKKLFFTKLYPYLRSNQFLSLAGNLTVSAMSIVSVSLLFRALPVQDIGMWVIFNTTIGLADSFRAGFLTTAFIRACSGATVQRATEVIGSAWAIALAITGALGLLSLGSWITLNYTPDGGAMLLTRWFGVVLVATLPYFMAACVLQAEMRFDRILYIRLLSQGLFVLGIIGLMATGTASLERVMYCYLLASAITSLLTLALGWARPSSLAYRTSACIRELAHFGKYSVGSYVGSSLLRSSDTFLINFLLGPAPVAVYNLASRFMELIDIPLRSFMATAIPTLSAAFNQKRLPEVARLLRKHAGMLTWIFVPVILGTIILADIPVYLIGGAKYRGTEAANLLRISMAIAILYPIDRFVGVTLDVVNQPRLNLFKVFLMLTVNVVGDVTAILLFHSIYGVAVASLPTAITGFVFGYFQLRKFLPLSIKDILSTGFEELRTLVRVFFGKDSLKSSTAIGTQPDFYSRIQE